MSIAEFILARIVEKEASAKSAYPSPWRAGGDPGGYVWTGADDDPDDGPTVYVNGGIYANQRRTAEHIARAADPDRSVAECEVHRRIVELHDGPHECSTYDHTGDVDNCTWCLHAEDCSTLRLLASLWADHPDFDARWRL